MNLQPKDQQAGGPRQSWAAEPEELPLQAVVAMLWRGRWVILACALLALVGGWVFVERRGSIHRVTSHLYLERSGSSLMTAEGLLLTSEEPGFANSQVAVLRSTQVLREALSRPEISSSPVFEEAGNKIGWLKSNLRVSAGFKNDILSVSLESTHTAEACEVVNAIVDAFAAFHSDKKKETVRDFLKRLQDERDRDRASSEALITQMTEFVAVNQVHGLESDASASLVSGRLNELRKQRDEAAIEVEQAQLELVTATAADFPDGVLMLLRAKGWSRGSQTFDVHDAQFLEATRGQLDRDRRTTQEDLERQIAQRERLLIDFTPEHPSIVEVDLKVAQTESALRAIGLDMERLVAESEETDPKRATAYLSLLESEVRASEGRLVHARTLVEAQEVRSQQHTLALLEYSQLKFRREQLEEDIAEVTQQISTLNLADHDEDGQSALNIDVLDQANVGTATLATSRVMTMAFFLFFGLLTGAGLSWLRSVFDQRLQSVEDVKAGLGLRVLTTVPHTALKDARGDALQIWDRFGALAESIRSLRTAVYFGIPADAGRVIQVTSPGPAAGKSLVTSQLGIAMALAGQRTLIVDADLRTNDQANLFGFGDAAGLTEMIKSKERAEGYILKTSVEGLDVLLSGKIPSNPGELINSQDFKGLLSRLDDSYDRVLVDSPPTLDYADARVVATNCDATVLVFRIERTTRRQAREAYEGLLTVGAQVLGTVVNDVPKSDGSRYLYKSGYGTPPPTENGSALGA